MQHCIGREYEWRPNDGVIASMGTRPPSRHVRYFHAVAITDGTPVTEAVCGEKPDDIEAGGDWQDPTIHLYGERCPDCLEAVPASYPPQLRKP
jgi:hypothetical protein